MAAADGGFWLAGSTAQGDIYLVKMDADGNVQRAITYDGGAFERAGTILATSDGGFLLVGSTSPGYPSPAQPLVVKLDGSGRVQWSRTYTLSSSIVQTFLFSVVQTADGGFLVGGDRSIDDYRTDQTTYSIIIECGRDGSAGVGTHEPELRERSPGGYGDHGRWGRSAGGDYGGWGEFPEPERQRYPGGETG